MDFESCESDEEIAAMIDARISEMLTPENMAKSARSYEIRVMRLTEKYAALGYARPRDTAEAVLTGHWMLKRTTREILIKAGWEREPRKWGNREIPHDLTA